MNNFSNLAAFSRFGRTFFRTSQQPKIALMNLNNSAPARLTGCICSTVIFMPSTRSESVCELFYQSTFCCYKFDFMCFHEWPLVCYYLSVLNFGGGFRSYYTERLHLAFVILSYLQAGIHKIFRAYQKLNLHWCLTLYQC